MPDLPDRLKELLRAATVQIHGPEPVSGGTARLWGSGFFVAPGWILTCAHVLVLEEVGAEDTCWVSAQGFNGGRAAEARPHESLWDLSRDDMDIPYDKDLVLLRLTDAELYEAHESVWLADWPGQTLGDEYVIAGYLPRPVGAEPGAYRLSVDKIRVFDQLRGQLMESQVRYEPGISGSPVVDPGRGAVVGVMKAGRDEAAGGASIPLRYVRDFHCYAEMIAAHDDWHHRRRDHPGNWVGEQGGPGHADAGGWTPEERRTALGLLAALRWPPEAKNAERHAVIDGLARAAHSMPRSISPGAPLRSWRDGHGELYDGARPMSAEVFVVFLRNVRGYARSCEVDTALLDAWLGERPPAVQEPSHGRPPVPLAPWVVREPPSAVSGPYPEPAEGGSVVVLELERVYNARTPHYFWSVRIDHEDDQEDEAAIAGQLTGDGVADRALVPCLAEPLAEAFDRVDLPGRPAPLEIVLGVEDFDEPFHQWQLNHRVSIHQDESRDPLGVHRPVVLRRRPAAGQVRDHDDAWQEVQDAGQVLAQRIPAPGTPFRRRAIERLPGATVPVLCRSARDPYGKEMLGVIIGQGRRIALWDVRGHEGRPCHEGCDLLHEQVREVFEKVREANRLPYGIWHLRRELAVRRTVHPVAGIALLYDRPVHADLADLDVLDSPA